jgi:hypothetical protein
MILTPASGEPYPGSIIVNADCGHDCWSAPANKDAILDGKYHSVCIFCIPGDIIEELKKGAFELGVTPGTDQEMQVIEGWEGLKQVLNIKVIDP